MSNRGKFRKGSAQGESQIKEKHSIKQILKKNYLYSVYKKDNNNNNNNKTFCHRNNKRKIFHTHA